MIRLLKKVGHTKETAEELLLDGVNNHERKLIEIIFYSCFRPCACDSISISPLEILTLSSDLVLTDMSKCQTCNFRKIVKKWLKQRRVNQLELKHLLTDIRVLSKDACHCDKLNTCLMCEIRSNMEALYGPESGL